jgi:hypothetical protein
MENQLPTTTRNKKVEFLLVVLEAEEKRRNSMENKCSILIASNAILLGTIISIGIPSLISGVTIASILKMILFTLALAALITSVYLCVQVLVPSSQRRAAQIMGWDKDSSIHQDLMYFGDIAKLETADLLEKVHALSEQEILEQITSRVHDLSRLLSHRYQVLRVAHGAFVIAVVTFVILALTRLFTG